MINRTQRSQPFPINITGSSTFGRYPKMSSEKTINMFVSDNWMVPYAGYKSVLHSSDFGNAVEGRAIHTSTKLNKLVAIFDNRVYLIDLTFDQLNHNITFSSVVQIGLLQTSRGICYITENNKPQIVISDNHLIYFYDPTLTPHFQVAKRNATDPISFTPGFIDFHDTYILCAASNDTFEGGANNTWRLGTIDPVTKRLVFEDDSATVGLLQTKPDNTQAVVRFPSRGNMVFVMGKTVAEPWFDVGYQLFPYQRSPSFNVDYGCLNPATIASVDENVAWLAQNEKSGPIIVYSDGGTPKKITTDGIDYFMSQMQNPSDSRAFMYRQDGHLFYHINFYTDNLSLFYDFNTQKFYHASDENGHFFIADAIAFFNNQYYFVSHKNANLYAFDTVYTTYDGLEIPRTRICRSARLPSQEYFIANDVGFTIEMGETPYQRQVDGPIYLITQDGKKLITQGDSIFMSTQNNFLLESQDDFNFIYNQVDPNFFAFLIANQPDVFQVLPRVDLAISIDGGVEFSSQLPYTLNPPGVRKNKLLWWNLGAANDFVCMFNFWGLGRFVAYDGILNIRQ